MCTLKVHYIFLISDSNCPEFTEDIQHPVTMIPLLPKKTDQSKVMLQNDKSQSNLMSILKDNKILADAKHLKHLIMPTNARHSSKKLKNRINELGKQT